MQSARAAQPAEVEEVLLSMPPERRVAIEALAVDMRMAPWQLLDLGLQEGLKQHGRDGRVPPASGAQLAAVLERAVKPDDAGPERHSPGLKLLPAQSP